MRSLLLVAAMLVSSGARADPTEADVATARELAKQAFTAYDAQDYAKAEGLFDRASQLYPAPTIFLGLARSRVKLGKYVKARENYNAIIKKNLAEDASDAFVEAQAAARTEVTTIEPKIAWVTITVRGVDPAAIMLTLDGEEMRTAAIGVRRPVDPGSHVVRATGEAITPHESSFDIGEGATKTVEVALQANDTPSPTPKPVGPVPAPVGAGESSSPLPMVGFVLLGVGGAALIAGAIAGGVAVSQHGELSDNCTDNRCEPEQYDTLDGFGVTSTVSTVALIAGGVLAATGLTLVLVAPSGDGATASLTLSPTSLSLSTRF